MKILKNVSLKLYSTMRLGGSADFLTEAKSRKDLADAEAWAEEQQVPVRIVGDGSNIIWRDEGFKGLIIVNKIRGFKKLHEDELSATYQIGSGENWDTIVDQTVGLKLQGIECLSLIPGTSGATPVQNVGAYGQEIASTLIELEAYDRMEKDFVIIKNEDCAFGYRTSRFKTVDTGRFLISSITLKLSKQPPSAPYYESVQKYFDQHKIDKPRLEDVRKAVIAIRSSKLPDPAKVANNGSFFANPIVDAQQFKKIRSKYKDIVAWELPGDTYKISAAWLLEAAGFKRGKKDAETGMATWKNQALVLVNERAGSTNDLLNFQQKITDKVYTMFQINLEREPELLP
jgi:UDP-N-acetylmuramate dehydrogenase